MESEKEPMIEDKKKDLNRYEKFEKYFREKLIPEMEYANKEIQNLEKLFLVNLELEKELLQDGWKFFFRTLLNLLERELKGDLKTSLDINIMGSFISTLTRAGYDLSYNSEEIVLKKTWKANHK